MTHGRHRSLIAGRGSSPLVELFYAYVSVGNCTYRVSVLSGVGIYFPPPEFSARAVLLILTFAG